MPFQRDYYIGEEALHLRGVLKLRYPMEQMDNIDFTSLEKVIHYFYYTQMRIDPTDQPSILAINPLWSDAIKLQMIENLFDTFMLPGLFFLDFYSLLLMHYGKRHAFIFDIHENSLSILTYYNNNRIPELCRNLPMGTKQVKEYLNELLKPQGLSMSKIRANSVLQDILMVLGDPMWGKSPENIGSSLKKATYVLPEGERIEIGIERSEAFNVLLNPKLIGSETPSLITIFQEIMTSFEAMYGEVGQYIIDGGIFWGGWLSQCKNFLPHMQQELFPTHWQQISHQIFIHLDELQYLYNQKTIIPQFLPMYISRREFFMLHDELLLRHPL